MADPYIETGDVQPTYILAMQARSLICILEDMVDVDSDEGGDARQMPHSYTQKRWACLRSLRMHVDALAGAAGAMVEETPLPSAPAPESTLAGRDRGYLTRQAMSNLLMAAMEMHTVTGRTDSAFVLTEKALAAIGALRVMTNDGRVQP